MGKRVEVFFLSLAAVFALSFLTARAAEEPSNASKSAPANESSTEVAKDRGNLDGVYVEAVENYPYPQKHEIQFGTSLYPFNSYFTGLALTGGYTFHFNESFAWEVANGAYFFSFDKDLASQLATSGFRTDTLNRLNYLVTSNAVFIHTHGKFVFLKNFIRYFRTSVLAGPGLVSTKKKNKFAANMGLKFSVFLSDRFSMGVEVRDAIGFGGISNYVTFGLNTAVSF